MNAMSLSFLPGFGFGIAATALVGQSIGARQPEEARVMGNIATLWGVIWMSLLGLIFLLFPEPIMRFFSSDPEIVATGASGLRIIAFTQPFWAVSFVQAGALRGTGDTQYPLWVNTIAIWAAVGLGALLVWYVSSSMAAAWASFLLTAPVSAWLLWRRFHRVITTVAPTVL